MPSESYIGGGYLSGELTLVPEGSPPPLEEFDELEGEVVTFTLNEEYDPFTIQASFVCHWNRETYFVQHHLKGNIIVTTDEYIKQGLRDLGIFTEG
jgi:hypothetical protein